MEEGADLTLRNTVLNGETTLIHCDPDCTLRFSGSSELLSRADEEANKAPAIRAGGNLTIDGAGSLYIFVTARTSGLTMDQEDSILTINGGTLTIEKEGMLRLEGGALYANTAHVVINGGTVKIHTDSDNVSAISAKTVTINGGSLLTPYVVKTVQDAAGNVIAMVFNTLGAMTGNAITFFLIAMIGNALNFALNLLGCFVHDLRLQVLEFFGRFYKDGGKPYKPLNIDPQYVDIIKEEI